DTLPPAINTPELRFEVKEEEKFAIVDAIKAQLMADNANVSTVDGVRVSTPQGWWLLRASNTQNVLVARAEANNDTDLAMLTKTLDDTLRAAGVNTTQQAEH
ncbi:MAG: phosphomannomutase, partial [Alphaproteobacteria bacterium]|nr:phosphomannomutase [Alphaproteobacteria bacterium]